MYFKHFEKTLKEKSLQENLSLAHIKGWEAAKNFEFAGNPHKYPSDIWFAWQRGYFEYLRFKYETIREPLAS